MRVHVRSSAAVLGIIALSLPASVLAQSQPTADRQALIEQGKVAAVWSTTDEAEREGASWPQVATERKCVDAKGKGLGPVYSGEMTMGGGIGADIPLRAGRVGKIWFKPLRSDRRDSLVLRARNVEHPAATLRDRSGNWVWNEGGVFFATAPTFPAQGTWILVATSGENWGCFVLHVEPAPEG